MKKKRFSIYFFQQADKFKTLNIMIFFNFKEKNLSLKNLSF